jgi:hypothetical protein
LLVSVTILSILVLLAGNIISKATDLIESGTRRASEDMAARRALEYFSRDFSSALGTSRFRFYWDQSASSDPTDSESMTYDAFECHAIKFVSVHGNPPRGEDEARLVYYFVAKDGNGLYELRRGEEPVSFDATATGDAWGNAKYTKDRHAAVLKHVVEFRTECYTYEGGKSGPKTFDANAWKDELPAYIDVHIATLSPRDVARAKTFSEGSDDKTTYIKTHEQRYFTRCFSFNRNAYKRDR